ncbi:hypothetical protein [Mesorhizobium sp. J428]|uniref:hypothetical protein n=1 Tax=Mesorhizobium sp. J428 TaxID=2898440 RepID=UPI002151C9D1|nr:hypothetical protein [Mesorhizobium sp. J428]MCR5859733.1 hypothetical protein [Mesorhizobium sp. J428]
MTGSIPKIPFALPNIAARPTFSIPDAEKRILDFEDIELWLQPDLGNVRAQASNYLSITGRKGWLAQSNDAKIVLGTGMEDIIPTINFTSGNTTAGKNPLHVPGFVIDGSYFVAVLLRFAAGTTFDSTTYRIISGGISGGTDVEFYCQNDRLSLRHGSGQSQTLAQSFAADTSYLIWGSYDAGTNQAAVGINSPTALVWSTDNLTGAAGSGREIVIGGQFNAGRTQGEQLFNGQMRGFWAGRTAWVEPEFDVIRAAFLGEIASLYPDDITLT